jgi:actin-related protein 10
MLFFAAPAKKQITLTMSAVVLDLGARLIKVGFAGDAHPSHIYSGNINSSLSDVALRSALRSMFFERLVINPRDRRVVVCENLLWPSSFRTALLHALFALEVPAVKFIPVLALPVYALSPLQSSAATTNNPNQIDCSGLVIDIADSETRVMPICDGFAQTELLTVAPVGVGAVVDRLQSLVAADAPTSVTLTSPQWSDAAARFCFVRPSKDFGMLC